MDNRLVGDESAVLSIEEGEVPNEDSAATAKYGEFDQDECKW